MGRVIPVLEDLEGLPAWVPNLVETHLVQQRGPVPRPRGSRVKVLHVVIPPTKVPNVTQTAASRREL